MLLYDLTCTSTIPRVSGSLSDRLGRGHLVATPRAPPPSHSAICPPRQNYCLMYASSTACTFSPLLLTHVTTDRRMWIFPSRGCSLLLDRHEVRAISPSHAALTHILFLDLVPLSSLPVELTLRPYCLASHRGRSCWSRLLVSHTARSRPSPVGGALLYTGAVQSSLRSLGRGQNSASMRTWRSPYHSRPALLLVNTLVDGRAIGFGIAFESEEFAGMCASTSSFC